jgi:hypothetical protein
MQQRRATAADWNVSGYVLAAGEIGVTTDTGVFKWGDGVNAWSDLPVAFEAVYLSLEGTAANSDLLGGVSVSSLVKVADTDVNPTNNTYVKRTADGGVKVTDATEATEATSLQQMQGAVLDSQKLLASRTVTTAATLAAGDANKAVYVNQASLTTNVVVTIPTNATVAFPVGTIIEITAYGAGGAKLSPAGGVTLLGVTTVMPDWGTVRLVKSGTDSWYGVTINAGKRLPTICVRRTAAGDNYTASYVFVPWDTLDTVETYNPDSEWFTIPGTGLSTARRIICNKDGEYLFNLNLNVAGTNVTWARIAKMTADNSTTGMKIIAVHSANGVFSVTTRKRVVAGESFGAHHGFATGSTGIADAEATGGNPCNFKIARLSD